MARDLRFCRPRGTRSVYLAYPALKRIVPTRTIRGMQVQHPIR